MMLLIWEGRWSYLSILEFLKPTLITLLSINTDPFPTPLLLLVHDQHLLIIQIFHLVIFNNYGHN